MMACSVPIVDYKCYIFCFFYAKLFYPEVSEVFVFLNNFRLLSYKLFYNSQIDKKKCLFFSVNLLSQTCTEGHNFLLETKKKLLFY